MISFQHLTANQTYVQSINYFSWTCSKLRSTPKSYLHTYLSRESFIRHLEYWFHHLLLVGCKHKHELIKRAHQYRSTNISWIVKHWKFFIKYSTMSQPAQTLCWRWHRVLQEKKSSEGIQQLPLSHRDIDFALSTIKKVRSQMFHG